VKRDIIKAAPHRTASDLLLVVPGVFVTQHSGQGKAHQIFLRGFDAVHGQDLEIWAGGAPVNEVSNVHGQGYADMHFLMPEVVRRIRSLPGPYDPRQGDFAVAGSIFFDLGYDEPGVTASGTLGSFGEQRAFLAYRPVSAPETTFAAFEVESTDGFGPARAARRVSGVGQATFSIGDAAEGRVMASVYSARYSSAGVVRLRDIETGAIDPFASYDPKQGGDSSRAQIVLSLSSSGGDKEPSSFSFAPYFIARSLRLRSNFTGFLEDPIDGDSTQQTNRAMTVGATGHYRRSLRLLSDHDALEAGVSVRADFIEQTQRKLAAVGDKAFTPEVDADVRATDIAGYIDASVRPIRRVAVRGGLRVDGLSYSVDDHTENNSGAVRTALGAHFGGKATVDVATLPGLHALASFGQGFRSPQARSLGDNERTPFTRVLSFEGGLRYSDGGALQSSASVFHTELSDDLVFDQASARNESVPSTQRTGLALDLLMRPRPFITTSASFTYTRASFTATADPYKEGFLVPYAPQIVARSDVAFTPRVASFLRRDLRLHAGAGLTFLAARPLPDAQRGHDVFLADASVGLRLQEVELKLDAYNLLDALWYDGEFIYASSFTRGAAPARVPQRHVTVGAPRSLFVTLSLFI
jgi:iron complex outermembrane receptor protein